MVYNFEIFRKDKGIVVLQSLKVSHLSIIPNIFYESPKLDYARFPKSGHIYTYICTYVWIILLCTLVVQTIQA